MSVVPSTCAHRRAGTAIGIDAGIRRLLTFDDGTFVENPSVIDPLPVNGSSGFWFRRGLVRDDVGLGGT